MADPGLTFGLPQKGIVNAPLKYHREPLRAEGNLSYREFIVLVKHLWEKAHPDIPIMPTQSEAYAKYPVIVYGLELRRPFSDEAKARYRDEHKVVGDDQVYVVTGQRFTNIIKFSVVTRGEPELCEQIIEVFEDFMYEHTKVFKRLGVSEFMYSRRIPDDEATRMGEDVSVRAVAYMVVLEKLHQTTVEKLNEVVVNARTFVQNLGINFVCGPTDTFITVYEHDFGVGDRVTIYNPANTETDALPPNLHHGWTYEITATTQDTITLSTINGATVVDPGGVGSGRVYLNDWYPQSVNIEDLYQTATPSI